MLAENFPNMTIWAFNKPNDENISFVYESVLKGRSHFGWSYVPTADLRQLEPRPWAELSPEETDCFKKSNFLLRINPGDWIVHINVPSYGRCVAARVTGTYEFATEVPFGDFRHYIPVDPATVIPFDRTSPNVLPIIEQKLKLRGRHWRIHAKEEFLQSIENLKGNKVSVDDGVTKQLSYLRQQFDTHLQEITSCIHKTHLRKHLEDLVAQIFQRIPSVSAVKVNGSRYGTDYGADVIVEYKIGLPLPGLERDGVLVVQVKSYEDHHWETVAVDQLETAIEKYGATAGLLVTTGAPTEQLTEAIDKLRDKVAAKGVDVGIVAGCDVARFMLRFGGDVILGSE
ncbi:MAG: restriction endonuclease [Verrucomicrobiota bacterium]